MNNKRITLAFILFCFFISVFAQSPRLYLTPEKTEALKSAISEEGSHHQQLFELIKERVDNGSLDLYGGDRNNYKRSYQAVENALVYQLSGDTAYAEQAFNILLDMYTSGDEGTPTIPDTGNYETKTPGSKALTYAFPSMAYGICYDWAASGWDDSQRDTVMSKMLRGLDDWKALFRWELYDMPVSNWVSVCRSAEMIMMLGAGEEENRPERYDTLKYLLRLHYDLAYGETGYSNEGIGYINYGVPFAYAANYAALSIGDSGLVSSFEDKDFHKLLMYTFAYTEDKKHLMTSVDAHYPLGEGLFGLVMGDLDTNALQYYKSFYDHHLGVASEVDNNKRFDQNRLGAVWNFIFYPTDMESVNPTGHYDLCLEDHEFGAYFIRSRWKNKNDILINAMGKYNYHRKGWQDAETFNIGLVAFGEQFFGSPGKGAEDKNYSSLLVDGNAKASSKHTGSYRFFEEKDNEVYIIIGGGSKYAEMGVNEAERHVFVKFLNDTTAIFSTLDLLDATTEHTYRWQLNIGHEGGDGGITTTTESLTHPTFELSKNGKDYVKGWNLSHTGAEFLGHDPLFIESVNAKRDSLWVVMCVSNGIHPQVNFYNSGMKTVMAVNDNFLYFNPDSNRIVLSESNPVTASYPKFQEDVQVYPNPAAGEVNIHCSDNKKEVREVRLISSAGQLMLQRDYKQKVNHLKIDTTRVTPGAYQLLINFTDGTTSRKPLIIQYRE